MTTSDETTEVQAVTGTVQVGETLLQARQSLGLSLDEVANKLKLSKRQIEAIEHNRFNELPGNTFVRGFVRNYARLLEVPVEPLIAQLELALPKNEAVPVLPSLRDAAQPLPVERRPSWLTLQLGAVVSVVATIVGVSVFWVVAGSKTEPELSVPPVQNTPVIQPVAPVAPPEVSAIAPAVAGEPVLPPQDISAPLDHADAPVVTPPLPVLDNKTVTPAVAPMPTVNLPAQQMQAPNAVPTTSPKAPQAGVTTVSPAVPGNEIKISAPAEDSWVLLTDATGNKLINSVVKAGTDRVVTGTPPFKVVVGNAGKTRVFYKGVETPLAPYTKSNVATLDLK